MVELHFSFEGTLINFNNNKYRDKLHCGDELHCPLGQ